MSTKQIEVQIMGQSYLLGCPEGGEERLLSAVERVDAAMCKIRDGGKIKARDRIAVLAALNLAFDHNEAVTSSASAPASAVPSSHEGTDTRLQGLLERLDRTLHQDGQLL